MDPWNIIGWMILGVIALIIVFAVLASSWQCIVNEIEGARYRREARKLRKEYHDDVSHGRHTL